MRVSVEIEFWVSFVIEVSLLEMLSKVKEVESMLYTIISLKLICGWAGVVALLERRGRLLSKRETKAKSRHTNHLKRRVTNPAPAPPILLCVSEIGFSLINN